MQAVTSSGGAQTILVTAAIMLLVAGCAAYALFPGLRAKLLHTAAKMGIYDRRRRQANPLPGLIQSGAFDKLAENAAERAAMKSRLGSLIYGRIDHLNQVGQIWGESAREEAVKEVARIMRAGTRTTDIIETDPPAGIEASSDGSFVIHVDGANEKEANAIAQRLIRALGTTPIPAMGEGMRLTASFGVAQRREGETNTSLYARAHAVLNTAQNGGEDTVLSASDWEEMQLLPAPGQDRDDLAPGSQTASKGTRNAA